MSTMTLKCEGIDVGIILIILYNLNWKRIKVQRVNEILKRISQTLEHPIHNILKLCQQSSCFLIITAHNKALWIVKSRTMITGQTGWSCEKIFTTADINIKLEPIFGGFIMNIH